MSNDPVLIAYGAAKTRKGARIWKQVGVAYPHDEGAGLTVVLELMPFDGKIVLLERDDADDARIAREAARRADAGTGRVRRGQTSG